MKFALLSSFAATAIFVSPVLGATYQLSDNIVGSAFLNTFNFEAISDPTHGRVNYVDANTARSKNLTFASGDTFILRADSTTRLSASGPGRDSVRIRSNKVYTTHVAVFNMRHMPQGCGTWPAVWETNEGNWPNGGEIDILEGVNDQAPNAVTLHTSAGCTMPASRAQTGTAGQNDCNVAVNGNTGCGVRQNDAASYGPSFNSNGGGWFTVERTNSFIKVWFWGRNAGNVPSDVRNGASSVNTDAWGTPAAFFPNTQCDIASHFNQHNIIINLTFCGDWAGSVYAQSGCPSTCNDFVENNPGSFSNAFFDFASLRYAANITIGGQNVIVILDTGSTDLWVYLPDQKPQLTNSTSIVGNLTYASGSAEGPINFAALEFAGFSVPSQAFIDVTQTADMEAIFDTGASGILGLGFDATNSIITDKFEQAFGNTTTLGRSPIANIFYQNMTLPNFFTLLLGRTDDPDDERAGVFTVSEYISEFSAVGDTPKLTIQTPDHWSVLVDEFKVGGRSLPLNSSVATVSQGKAIAVLDSGTSLSLLPYAMVDAIYGAIPGSARISDVPGFNASWIIPCNQSTEVSFSIGGRDFPVHPLDLTAIDTKLVNGTNVTYCANTYQSIEIGRGELDMILGDAFLKNVYVSFDYGSFDDQGHLTEQPFIQLLPTTNSKEAWAEFTAIRAKALEGTVELAPSELRILAMQDNTDDHHPDAPIDEASKISGVLATSDDADHIEGAAAGAIQRYAPVVIGLLSGNLLILVVICVLGLYFCISKGGRNGKSAPANYHPVKLQKGDSQFVEPVFETRYDS
ncbi:hypothetical protein CCMSSC00406_0006725 [Pleurotus cornucopiae]|uniref:Uncharacterized protein n=1 Tax=Pleurotus cornucopiae TaxID=5321 RepID=A0ACB7IU35_PLECO|nr:hypothetical protein CCMSSC00406_0006725 [Pleurotus cornucopiae]